MLVSEYLCPERMRLVPNLPQPRFESFLLFGVHASGIRIFVKELKSLFRLQCYCSIVLLAMHDLLYPDWLLVVA